MPLRPPHIMEGLNVQPLEEDGVILEEESEKNREQEEGEIEASSPVGSTTTDEETDEDSEPEPPQVIRRKVSFADAFGLNLVSVKEFDNVEVTESEVSHPPESEAAHPLVEFNMSCLFTVPSSPEELDQRLQAQMVELESIELLPGTTTLRGIIRVVNLCYSKSVYARITLDRWTSYFDLLAEYVPGSSDKKTDRFTFTYTLVPPSEREGTRVEVCLRYETSVGTFWANNQEMNYVLFCYQKGHVKEHGPQVQEESSSYRSKRSCLKAKRRGSAEEKTRATINTSTAAAESEAAHKAEKANRMDITYLPSLLYHEEHKPLVDSKSRQRAARLARVHDYLSQKRQQVPKAYSHDSVNGQKVSQPLPTPRWDSASFLHKRQKKQSNESPRVLTYHQIPLLTLDWNSDRAHQWGAAEMDDIWTGRGKMTLSGVSGQKIEDTTPVNDMWETLRNSTDHTADKETSVCDAWQAFLNGSSHTDHSGVPESEWLQTAASVSPSNVKEPNTQHAESSQELEFQVGADTPTTLRAHTSAECHLLSDTCKISLANVALNTEDQPVEACVSTPSNDNTVTQDFSQMNSVKDIPQEICLKRAVPVSEGSVDSSEECHKHVIIEKEREGIMGSAEGIGRDELFTPHTYDLVTSSGESETTDMTAMPESQNATAVDRISQEASLDEGLSSSREGEVTGTTHNVMDDTLAFRGTIRKGTKDGESFVFSKSGQGLVKGIKNNCVENKVCTDEEIFKPQETGKEECEISHESKEIEMRLAQTNAEETNPSETSEESFEQSRITASKFKLEDSEGKDVASTNKDLEAFEMEEVEPSNCTKGDETQRLIGEEVGTNQVLNKRHNDNALQLSSSWQKGNTSVISEIHNKQLRPIKAGEEVCIQKEEGDSTQEEVSQRLAVESREMKKVFQADHDVFRPFPTDKCNPDPEEMVGMRWTHSQDDKKGQKEDAGNEMSPEEVRAEKNVAKKDTSTELQHEPETPERTEGDMSKGDKDVRVSIGKLKIEVLRELLGNGENPQGERKNAPAELKEQKLLAEVKISPCVEYKKLSKGTEDPIKAETTAALEVMDSGLEEMFIERFVEDLVRGIWEEVFGREQQASFGDTDIVGGMGGELSDVLANTQDCHLLYEKDFNDAFDSSVFSLTELPTDPNLSLCQGLKQSPQKESRLLTIAEHTHFLSESQTDLNSSAHLSQDLPVLAAQSRPSLTESAQSSPEDRENYPQIKEGSVTWKETGRQAEDCVVTHRESSNQSVHPSLKRLSSSSDKLKESDSVVLWSMLYILSHITRLLICTLLLAGFFFIVFLYDFPAFFALYVFSLCCWFYKWKKHRVTSNKGMVG